YAHSCHRDPHSFPTRRSSDLQNTKDQVYAQNEMLAYQQKESTARVASIMENTNPSKQQQVSEIMRQMLTQAQTAGQYTPSVDKQDRKSGSAGMPRPISFAGFG